MEARKIETFADFWPYYVSEHSRRGTRLLHLAGTMMALGCALLLILIGRWQLFPLMLIPGYGGAWIGHYFVEHNRPATFKYPLWSFLGDYKMVALMIFGKMDREVDKFGARIGSN